MKTQTVTVNVTQAIEVNFELVPTGILPPYNETRKQIDNAITTGYIGGELTIWRLPDQQIQFEEIRYSDIIITLYEIDEDQNTILLSVNGEINTGKTIVITLDNNVLPLETIKIKYDGLLIKQAAGFLDIIDANDDGSNPEYYPIREPNQTILLISVPHFSEHTITISSLVEALGGTTALLWYIFISLCLIILIIIPILVIERK
jgi:hypothetical protein